MVLNFFVTDSCQSTWKLDEATHNSFISIWWLYQFIYFRLAQLSIITKNIEINSFWISLHGVMWTYLTKQNAKNGQKGYFSNVHISWTNHWAELLDIWRHAHVMHYIYIRLPTWALFILKENGGEYVFSRFCIQIFLVIIDSFLSWQHSVLIAAHVCYQLILLVKPPSVYRAAAFSTF